MIPPTTDLASYDTVADIVDKYQRSQQEIAAGYQLLASAQKRMDTISKYFCSLPSSGHYIGDSIEPCMQSVLNKAKTRVWEFILDKTQAPSFMVPSRLKHFQDMLEKPDKLPEITPESIKDFVSNVLGSAPDLVVEFIKETFNWLHPGKWSCLEYKTNDKSKYELQRKVIKGWVCGHGYGSARLGLRYEVEKNIAAMENAFSLLDGKGTRKYPGNAVTKIKDDLQKNINPVDTEYFKAKFFKNGNAHITFKRLDLVAKMNQVAGENIVKPD